MLKHKIRRVRERKGSSDETSLLRMDTDMTFENQLRYAICEKNKSALLRLCSTGSNRMEIQMFKSKGKGLVHFAAILGSAALIECLISLEVDVRRKTEGLYAGQNALHLACKYGNIEVVTYLLRLVSDLSFRNAVVLYRDNYRNAFYYAATSGNIEIVNILKTVGKMNVNDFFPNNKTVLLTLVEEMDIKSVKLLCQSGANINIGHFKKRVQAIHIAAEKIDGEKLLALLLTNGAHVNVPWGNQQPLFLALKHGFVKNVKVLLKAGADVRAKGSTEKMGYISCFCLAAIRCPSLIPDFLSRGANSNELYDRSGDSVLALAFKNKASNEAVRALLKAGASFNRAFQHEKVKQIFSYGK